MSNEFVFDPMTPDEVRNLYKQQGTPEGKGIELLSGEEIIQQFGGNPAFHKALGFIRRAEGLPRWPELALHEALAKHVRHLDMHAAEQKRAIDLHLKKKQGVLEVVR